MPTWDLTRCTFAKSPLTEELLWISLCFSVSALLAEANPSNECSTDRGGPRGKHNFLRGCLSRKTRVLDAFDAEKKTRYGSALRATRTPESLLPPSSRLLLPAPADAQQVLSASTRVRLACTPLARRLRGGIATS